jgi:hypothetical protein
MRAAICAGITRVTGNGLFVPSSIANKLGDTMPNKGWVLRRHLLTGAPASEMDLPLWIAAGLGVLSWSIIFNSFGLLHFELWQYIPWHHGPGSAWIKTFNSRILDNGTYEGRKLSCLVGSSGRSVGGAFGQLGVPAVCLRHASHLLPVYGRLGRLVRGPGSGAWLVDRPPAVLD